MNNNAKFHLVIVFIIMTANMYADITEKETQTATLNIYVDQSAIDTNYLKTMIPFVNYVIDRTKADVHILISTQSTASEGLEHTIFITGQGKFSGMCDTLIYASNEFDTEDLIRKCLVKKIKMGLMRYIAKTDVSENIELSVMQKPYAEKPIDKWHNWRFSIGIDENLSGEQSHNYNYIRGRLSVDRVTEDLKINSTTYYNYIANVFQIDDTTKITSLSRSYGSSGYFVVSLNDHWSTGAALGVYSSTYSNEDFAFRIGPAVEYNIFPYSLSTSKALTLYYKIGYIFSDYVEETIYSRLQDKHFYESFSITLNLTQRWGSVSTTLIGSHYFHDFSKNSITLYNDISIPVTKGFSFQISSFFSMIHDQLSLPKRDLTPEEIILQIRQLSTQYYYSVSFGLTFTFGSMYSNVVNPRFGN